MCKLLGWDLGAVAYKAAIYSYMIYENPTNNYPDNRKYKINLRTQRFKQDTFSP